MTMRVLPLFLLTLAGCGTQLTQARVTIVFENETQTKCVKVSAKRPGGSTVNGEPAFINRGLEDELVIAIGETRELSGEIEVTVKRFAAESCPGMEFDSETKLVTLMRGPSAMLEFRYVGLTDGGVDAGTDGGTDGGGDAGCDTSMCPGPGECQLGSPACGCVYASRTPGMMCSTGVCNAAGACVANVCSVQDAGTSCNTGFACQTGTCVVGQCSGACTAPALGNCQAYDYTGCTSPTECRVLPRQNGIQCAMGRLCLDGFCAPWLGFSPPPTLRVGITDVPYPDAGWVLTSPDGGLCNTIISTTGPAATVVQSDCGAPPIFSTVDDAGVSVILMAGLNVGSNARVHFVGDRPAQLIVLGSAVINGMVSVAPFTPFNPAGSQPASCTSVGSGDADGEGGGGGGFGAPGGNGGNSGGAGGTANGAVALPIPLRGGCAGGNGFRAGGQIDGGRGGGALELIVSGDFTIAGGAVTASGEGGAAGFADRQGGGGGGTGGTVIIEAATISLNGGAVTANGGGGGEGGDNGVTIPPGPFGSIDGGNRVSTTDAGQGGGGGVGGARVNTSGDPGADNSGGNQGSGGGGAGVGVIFLRGYNSCTVGTGVFSPGGTFSCN
ncbi:MAG: hypothetical protein JNM17_01275 [Archangium sp.]|nr:hypothetical protein [Archangium sp.]